MAQFCKRGLCFVIIAKGNLKNGTLFRHVELGMSLLIGVLNIDIADRDRFCEIFRRQRDKREVRVSGSVKRAACDL